MPFVGFIDPPSPFAPVSEWRAYLSRLQAVDPRTPEIEDAISEAEKHLAEADR